MNEWKLEILIVRLWVEICFGFIFASFCLPTVSSSSNFFFDKPLFFVDQRQSRFSSQYLGNYLVYAIMNLRLVLGLWLTGSHIYLTSLKRFPRTWENPTFSIQFNNPWIVTFACLFSRNIPLNCYFCLSLFKFSR